MEEYICIVATIFEFDFAAQFFIVTFLTHTVDATVHQNGGQSLIYSSSYAHNTHKCMEGIFESLISLHDGSEKPRDWSKENELKQNKNICIRDLVKSAYSTYIVHTCTKILTGLWGYIQELDFDLLRSAPKCGNQWDGGGVVFCHE